MKKRACQNLYHFKFKNSIANIEVKLGQMGQTILLNIWNIESNWNPVMLNKAFNNSPLLDDRSPVCWKPEASWWITCSFSFFSSSSAKRPQSVVLDAISQTGWLLLYDALIVKCQSLKKTGATGHWSLRIEMEWMQTSVRHFQSLDVAKYI